MNEALLRALDDALYVKACGWTPDDEQRRVLYLDLLWKLVRKDYHGVADCAMDLRELHL